MKFYWVPLCLAFLLVFSGKVEGQVLKGNEFSIASADIAFTIPTGWHTVKGKYSTNISIPVSSGGSPAEMKIFVVPYHGSEQQWFDAEKSIDVQFKRVMKRQWTEQVMGVPLLLSESTDATGDGGTVQLAGLFYSATLNKMLFRIQSSVQSFDEVDSAWRKMFESMHSANGGDLKADNPATPPSLIEKVKPVGRPIELGSGTSDDKRAGYKGPVMIQAVTAKRPVTIHLPLGWTVTPMRDGSWELKNSGLSRSVDLSLASTLDSPSALNALFSLSSVSLGLYSTVETRDEVSDKLNQAGEHFDQIWRTGVGSKQKLSTMEAAIWDGDFYILFHVRFDDKMPTGDERSILNDLIQKSSISSTAK